MHWVDADEPDENAWGFLDCTGMLGRGVTPLMKTWARWMAENDFRSTYRDFRKWCSFSSGSARPRLAGISC